MGAFLKTWALQVTVNEALSSEEHNGYSVFNLSFSALFFSSGMSSLEKKVQLTWVLQLHC